MSVIQLRRSDVLATRGHNSNHTVVHVGATIEPTPKSTANANTPSVFNWSTQEIVLVGSAVAGGVVGYRYGGLVPMVFGAVAVPVGLLLVFYMVGAAVTGKS